MNRELLKQYAAVCEAFKTEREIMDINRDGRMHVSRKFLKELIGTQTPDMKNRGCEHFPYELSVTMEGIKIFAIAKLEDLNQYPQLKQQMKEELKADLQKQLAYLEEDVDLSGGEEIA